MYQVSQVNDLTWLDLTWPEKSEQVHQNPYILYKKSSSQVRSSTLESRSGQVRSGQVRSFSAPHAAVHWICMSLDSWYIDASLRLLWLPLRGTWISDTSLFFLDLTWLDLTWPDLTWLELRSWPDLIFRWWHLWNHLRLTTSHFGNKWSLHFSLRTINMSWSQVTSLQAMMSCHVIF